MKLIELLEVTKGMETFTIKDKEDSYLIAKITGSELKQEEYSCYHNHKIKTIVSLETLTVILDIYQWQKKEDYENNRKGL